MTERIPIWLDCDPGHDDAFAILLAAHHPRFNLLGISTVHGNASLARTTTNAGSVLTAIGRSEIPVYPGAAKPFCRDAVHAPEIHGESGLDGTNLLPMAKSAPVTDISAVLAARNALMSTPKQTAWYVATGTYTNAGLLFAAFPETAEWVKGVSLMGGAIGGGFTDAPMGSINGEGDRIGNSTQWAEFNVFCDPEAAHSILSNPVLAVKTTLVTLDLTHQALATPEVQDLLLNGQAQLTGGQPSTVRRLFFELLTFFTATYDSVFGISSPPLHDPVAVVACLDNMIAFDDNGGERWLINVVTDGRHEDITSQVGRTVATKLDSGKPGVRIPRALDLEEFWQTIDRCLQLAEQIVG